MGVIRVNKKNDYTVMSNVHFKERKMSLKAKGLLSLMLSLPDEWDYSIEGLMKLSSDGKSSVTSALQELERFNYLKRTLIQGDGGKFNGYIYDIYEVPYTENPFTEKPFTENPSTENRAQLNTNISNTKELNTYKKEDIPKGISKKESRFAPPTLEEVRDYCYERKNNIDPSKFIDFYESKGWMIGKNKMKDWKAAVRTWERRDPTPKDDLETREPELYKRLKNGELPF